MEPLKAADPTEPGGIALRGGLGSGGMGTVYYGVTPDGDQVAVKMIRNDLPEKSEVLGHFDREATAIGMVQGPRVANVIAVSAPDETPPWFAVEYVRGLILGEYVAEREPFPADQRMAVACVSDGVISAVRIEGLRGSDPLRYEREIKQARSLLFVAATRARDSLMIFWHGQPSPFLPA